MRMSALMGAALVLAGCGSAQQITQSAMDEDPQIASKPAGYRDGFREGCHSGIRERRGLLGGAWGDDQFIRDDARMKSDQDYAIGWQDGARRCSARIGGSMFIYTPRK